MKVLSVCSGPVATNAYLVIDEDSSDAIILDVPMGSSEWIIQTVEERQVRLTAVWLSHSHWDHTADCAALLRSFQVPVYCHPLDRYRLKDPNAHTVFPMNIRLEEVMGSIDLVHGQILELGNSRWEVRHTPGHTEGGVCIINHEFKIVLAGDTLFQGSIGRTDLPGGNYEQLIASIHRELLTLDDDYQVLPGHMDTTTIGEERDSNPFLLDGE